MTDGQFAIMIIPYAVLFASIMGLLCIGGFHRWFFVPGIPIGILLMLMPPDDQC